MLDRWSLPHLHMNELVAMGLTAGEIRNLRLDVLNNCFSETVRQFRLQFAGAVATVDLDDYRRAKADGMPRGDKSPEAICVNHVVHVALIALPEDPNPTAIPAKLGSAELYFDQNEKFMATVYKVWTSRKRGRLRGNLKPVSYIGAAESQKLFGAGG